MALIAEGAFALWFDLSLVFSYFLSQEIEVSICYSKIWFKMNDEWRVWVGAVEASNCNRWTNTTQCSPLPAGGLSGAVAAPI